MPRTPILARRGYFESVGRNLAVKELRWLEWNSVDTELGVMVEPRNFTLMVDGKVVQWDARDMDYNSLTEMSSSDFYQANGTYGPQRMIDFDY